MASTSDLAAAPAFLDKKRRILDQLAVPSADYSDASPKGSVDEGIRHLIDEINGSAGFVTTSSCAGRVSVFLEGRRVAEADAGDDRLAGVGGKGAGGTWLFVSHDPVPEVDENGQRDWSSVFGLTGDEDGQGARDAQDAQAAVGVVKESRLIHFKFEAMILHILTASPDHAQLLLRCGLQAGFRESGALNLLPPAKDAAAAATATPMVAIRTMGLAFESLIGQQEVDGGRRRRLVDPEYLRTVVRIANERFVENAKRIGRFRAAFRDAVEGRASAPRRNPEGGEWEDAEARRERKRAEGLRRKAEKLAQREAEARDVVDTTAETELQTGPLLGI